MKRYKSAKNAKLECFSVKGSSFGTKYGGKELVLKRHDETKVRKYVKIKAGASIYSGELLYFARRMSYHNTRMRRLRGLLKKQEYKCSQCGLIFKPEDIIELHHVLKEDGSRGDKMEFVHGHCHDKVHMHQKRGDPL